MQEDYHRLRPLDYTGTDIFLLCFAVDDRDTFEEIEEVFLPQMDQCNPGVPVVIVGCKVGRFPSLKQNVYMIDTSCTPTLAALILIIRIIKQQV